MIAAKNQRDAFLTGRSLDHVGQSCAGVSDLRKITCVAGASGQTLGLIHDDVAQVLDLVAKFGQLLLETGDAQGGRSHIHAAASRTQIHRRTDNGDVRLTHAITINDYRLSSKEIR